MNPPPFNWKHPAANLVVLWLFLLAYQSNRFYVGFLSQPTQHILLGLAIAYTVGIALYYALAYARTTDTSPPHAYIALAAIGRWLSSTRKSLMGIPQESILESAAITHAERTSILFLLVKFIYLPLMIEFAVGNWQKMAERSAASGEFGQMPFVELFNALIFPLCLSLIFTVDSALYAFGYLVESKRLENTVRSVEPTALGWAVTLACYPPFNGVVNNYVWWYASEHPVFDNPGLTFAARLASLLCYCVYIWGAASLGTKCSNLTNRGIVSTGAFGIVRHPAYISKNIAWWIGLLPAFSIPALLTMIFWSSLYFLRAITEERHLSHDAEYRDYCQRVRYRFIPGLY